MADAAARGKGSVAGVPERPPATRVRLSPGPLGASALAVGGLTLLAFVLRLAFLRDSLLGDELFMFRIVHDRSLGDVLSAVRETEKTPPLFFVLVWLSAKLGDPTVWVRVPSLLFGTALVPLTYVLGARTIGRAPAVVAAAVVALGPFAIFYATENRAYAAIAFLAALSTLCLVSALDTRERRWWAAYVVAVLAVLYTHYTGAFVVVAQAGWAFWTARERLRELLVVYGLTVLAYLPWLPSYVVQQRHSADEARQIAALEPPSLELFGRINLKALLGHPFASLDAVPGRIAIRLAVAVLAVATVAAAVRAWRERAAGWRPSPKAVLVALTAAATPVGVGLVSLRPDMSFLLARNVSASLAPAALVVGWLLVSLGRRAAVAAVALVLAVLAVDVVRSFDHEHRRSDYRAVARYVDGRARPGDPVIQHFSLTDKQDAPADALLVNFGRAHPLFRTAAGERRAWELGRRGASVFVVTPLLGPFKAVKHPGPTAGPGKRFRLVADRHYDGLEDLLVGEYRLGPT
jgi:Dolichyl-phosphate-mannose-protein mannosyltransferase